jgi:hypothetical protein
LFECAVERWRTSPARRIQAAVSFLNRYRVFIHRRGDWPSCWKNARFVLALSRSFVEAGP